MDPSTLPPLGEGAKLENLTLLSDVARRREEIQARFDRLFDALNVLDREFDPLNMELMSLSEDEPQSPLAEQAGVSMDEQHHLRAAVDAVHVALGLAQPKTDDPDFLESRNYFQFQYETGPAMLNSLRNHLETRRFAEVISLAEYPHGRNVFQYPDRKAFQLLLSVRLKLMVGAKNHFFVTEMTNALFARGGQSSEEATRQLIRRETKRNASNRY